MKYCRDFRRETYRSPSPVWLNLPPLPTPGPINCSDHCTYGNMALSLLVSVPHPGSSSPPRPPPTSLLPFLHRKRAMDLRSLFSEMSKGRNKREESKTKLSRSRLARGLRYAGLPLDRSVVDQLVAVYSTGRGERGLSYADFHRMVHSKGLAGSALTAGGSQGGDDLTEGGGARRGGFAGGAGTLDEQVMGSAGRAPTRTTVTPSTILDKGHSYIFFRLIDRHYRGKPYLMKNGPVVKWVSKATDLHKRFLSCSSMPSLVLPLSLTASISPQISSRRDLSVRCLSFTGPSRTTFGVLPADLAIPSRSGRPSWRL